MNLYWKEKNQALEKMLDIARNTWRTIEDDWISLEDRTYLMGRRGPTGDENGAI
jgi:hypothetical protein